LKKCSERIEATEKLYLEAAKMTKTLEEKYINATNEQKEWKDVKVKLAQTLLIGKVTLNVGGNRYTTRVDTLMRQKDTYFTGIFSQKWEFQLYHHSSYGPLFGSGPDLQLANNSNSSIGFRVTYTDTTGKGNTTFTGANTFITSEIEIFKLA
jgi:hypothetical protein